MEEFFNRLVNSANFGQPAFHEVRFPWNSRQTAKVVPLG